MRNELTELNSFFYGKHSILMTPQKIKQLIDEELISFKEIDKKIFFNKNEVLDIIKFETNLTTFYLSTPQFIRIICKTEFPNNFDNKISKIVDDCNQINKLKTIIYRESIYFNKESVNNLINILVEKRKIIKSLHINIFIYEDIVNKNKIPSVKISKNAEYISTKHISTFEKSLKNYPKKDRKIKWIKATKLILSEYFPAIPKKTDSLLRFCIKNNIHYYKTNDKILYIDFHSIDSFFRSRKNDYYSKKDMEQLLNLQNHSYNSIIPNLLDICGTLEIPYQKIDNNYFFDKRMIDTFFDEHISNREIVTRYSITYQQLKFLITYHEINCYTLNRTFKFFNRNNILKMIDNKITQLYLGDTTLFYTHSEVLEILAVNSTQLIRLKKEENISSFNMHGTSYFLKSEIKNLEIKKEYTQSKYIPSPLANKILGKDSYKFFQNKKKPIGIERFSFNKYSNISYLYKKKDFEKISKKVEINSVIDTISFDDHKRAFFQLITLQRVKFPTTTPLSAEYWFEFCELILTKTNKSKVTIPYLVNSLVKSTKIFIKFLNQKELFHKTSAEINLSLLNKYTTFEHRNWFHNFLKSFFYKVRENNIHCSYNLNTIKKATESIKPINQDDKIYDYETFKSLYNYINNTNHKVTAIEDALKITQNNSVDFAYSWLYALLHLNNAWRHRDFCNLEMIDISFLEIKSLKDFLLIELSEKEVNHITNLLLAKKYTVSKTKLTNHFVISEDIKHSLANAYLVCHLINIEYFPKVSTIINFHNENNHFLETQNNGFFNSFKNNFKFKNRKMNRTLLTVMYSILRQENQYSAAVNVSQYLRSHSSQKSTELYIKIPDEDINNLAISLFNRGTFGYIPKILNEIIYGKSQLFLEETNRIVHLNTKFKNVFNMEATAGFLNSMIQNKENLLNMLLKNGAEHSLDLLNKLQKNYLLAKDDNFQCIVAETGCQNNSMDCKNCVFSVPNFYATSNIVASIIDRIINLNDNISKSTLRVEKIKQANLLLMELDLLDYMMQKLGQNVVLEFFEEKKEGYLYLLDFLNNIDKNLDESILEISTYNLRGSE